MNFLPPYNNHFVGIGPSYTQKIYIRGVGRHKKWGTPNFRLATSALAWATPWGNSLQRPLLTPIRRKSKVVGVLRDHGKREKFMLANTSL